MKIGRTRGLVVVVVVLLAAGGSGSGLGPVSVSWDFVGSGRVAGAGSASGRTALSGSGIVVLSSGDEEGEDDDGSPVLLVRVEDVGTVVPRADRLREDSLRADEVVVDMMIWSVCDARLSDESLRRNLPLGLVDAFTVDATRGEGGG